MAKGLKDKTGCGTRAHGKLITPLPRRMLFAHWSCDWCILAGLREDTVPTLFPRTFSSSSNYDDNCV